MNNLILVTDWEKVENDDFYLNDKKWSKNEGVDDLVEKAVELQKEGKLYVAYIVNAVNYAIYTQMDADQVFIDNDGYVVLNCESAVIENNHKHREEYNN
jgi:hypothetical protein